MRFATRFAHRFPTNARPANSCRPVVERLEDRTLLDGGYLTVDPAVNISRVSGNQAEGTIVVDPTDPQRLFAASNDGMTARYSVDGGQTWGITSTSGIPASCCDNQAATDSFGNLFVVYLGPSFETVVAWSTNFGQSFAGFRTAIPGSTDQPSIGVGGSENPGEYTVWVSAERSSNIVAAGARVTGLGELGTFSTAQAAPGSGTGGTHSFGGTAVGPNGEVMVTYQGPVANPDQGPTSIYVNHDPDGLGPEPFGPRILATRSNVGTWDAIPAQANRTIDSQPNLAWDRSDGPYRGRVYLVYADEFPNESNDTDIMVRYSDDNGSTWSKAVRVNDDVTTRSQFNPAIAIDQTSGYVAVSWYDARNVAANNAAEVWATVSLDGGASWVENVKLSLGVTNCMTAGSFNCGDYDTMDFHGGYFYRIWADNSPELPGNPDRPRQDTATARVRVGNPAGPIIVSQSVRGTVDPALEGLRVTFNTPVDPKTFTPEDVSLSGPGGTIKILAVTAVDGTKNTSFDIQFAPLGGTGQYTFVLGPNIFDPATGNPMDQDGDGTPGEKEDAYRGRFNISGHRITAHTPAGLQGEPVGSVRVSFSRAVDPKTFTAKDVSFTGPGGAITVQDAVVVDGSEGRQFDVSFDPQGRIGNYSMVIGPDVLDLYGNPMDQNGNLTPGEVPGDRYTATFTLTGPRVLQHVPRGGAFDPVSRVRVTFNRPMDPATFTLDDVVAFIGPEGAIPVLSITSVKGSGDREFDFEFDLQTAYGGYTLVFGPDVRDLFDNQMDQNDNRIPGESPGDRYVATFQIADPCPGYEGFGYLSCIVGGGGESIVGQPGTFTILGTGRDLAGPVNLGSNTFNYYGTSYTGNNRMFLSNKGLITFVVANTVYTNTDLSAIPIQRAIAVLWDDWIKPTGGPSVVGLFVDYDGDGIDDWLILEWNQVVHFPSSPSGVSFQAILLLNTAGPGDFYFNYLDLDAGNPAFDNGASATVGIKDVNPVEDRRLLVAFNEAGSPYLGDGRALWFGYFGAGPAPGGQDGQPRLDQGALERLVAEDPVREWASVAPSLLQDAAEWVEVLAPALPDDAESPWTTMTRRERDWDATLLGLLEGIDL